MGPQVSDGKYALFVKLGVLAVGGILVVYERSTTETQSARRTHREKKTKIMGWDYTHALFLCWNYRSSRVNFKS